MTAQLVDTGVLFAYLSEDDRNHGWAMVVLGSIAQPLLTCEPVLTEAAYLLNSRGGDLDTLWSFLRRGALRIAWPR